MKQMLIVLKSGASYEGKFRNVVFSGAVVRCEFQPSFAERCYSKFRALSFPKAAIAKVVSLKGKLVKVAKKAAFCVKSKPSIAPKPIAPKPKVYSLKPTKHDIKMPLINTPKRKYQAWRSSKWNIL